MNDLLQTRIYIDNIDKNILKLSVQLFTASNLNFSQIVSSQREQRAEIMLQCEYLTRATDTLPGHCHFLILTYYVLEKMQVSRLQHSNWCFHSFLRNCETIGSIGHVAEGLQIYQKDNWYQKIFQKNFDQIVASVIYFSVQEQSLNSGENYSQKCCENSFLLSVQNLNFSKAKFSLRQT